MTVNHRHSPITPNSASSRKAAVALFPGRLNALLRSPWAVAALIFVVYGLYLLAFLMTHHDPRDFIHMERYYVERSQISGVIRIDPTYTGYNPHGYDGQFYYFIALDPAHAAPYVDAPAYRYTRILYPLTARFLALGIPEYIPYTLLLVNLLAVTGGTLALAAWLKRKRVSPWFALAYGFYPGIFIAFQNDLTEPMAYALVALAIYLFEFGGRYRLLWASITFALAALTRETTVVFPLVYGLAVLWGAKNAGNWKARLAAHWRQAALLLGIGVGALLLYKGFLTLWLGEAGFSHVETGGTYSEIGASREVALGVFPFQGLIYLWPWTIEVLVEVISIVVPALLSAGVALYALKRGSRQALLWALLLNVALFVVFLGPKAYENFAASEPVASGVVLAALCCFPVFDRVAGKSRWWFWCCLLLWQMALLLKITHSLFGFPHSTI